MKPELRQKIVEENKYYGLLERIPQYRLQGYSMKMNKVIVGVIQGDPNNYKYYKDHLDLHYFNSWKEAYFQLQKWSECQKIDFRLYSNFSILIYSIKELLIGGYN